MSERQVRMGLTHASSSQSLTVLNDLPGHPLPTHQEPQCFPITATRDPKPLCFLEGSVPTAVAWSEHPHLMACSGCACPSSATTVLGARERVLGSLTDGLGVAWSSGQAQSYSSVGKGSFPAAELQAWDRSVHTAAVESRGGDPSSSDRKDSCPRASQSEGPAALLRR